MTTLNLQVAAGADDSRESWSGGASHTATNTLQESGQGVPAYGAFRWQVNAPQGATIDSATLTLYCNSSLYDDPVTDIYGADADTVAAFDSTGGECSGLTPTTATVTWDGTALGTDGQTITVTAIVQEIVNRAGWLADNYMAMVVKSDTGCNVRLHLYEGEPTESAKLDITYTVPSTGGAVSKTGRARLSSKVGGLLT